MIHVRPVLTAMVVLGSIWSAGCVAPEEPGPAPMPAEPERLLFPMPDDVVPLGPSGVAVEFTGPGWATLGLSTPNGVSVSMALDAPDLAGGARPDHAVAYLWPRNSERGLTTELWAFSGSEEAYGPMARHQAASVSPSVDGAVLVVATSAPKLTVTVAPTDAAPGSPQRFERSLGAHANYLVTYAEPTTESPSTSERRHQAHLAVPIASPSRVLLASWASRPAEGWDASERSWSWEYQIESTGASSRGSSTGGHGLSLTAGPAPGPSDAQPGPKFKVQTAGPTGHVEATRVVESTGVGTSRLELGLGLILVPVPTIERVGGPESSQT